MTDGLCLGPLPPGRFEPLPEMTPNMLDLHTLRAWLNLQSVDTVAEVMAACVEELRQRRMSIPVSRDFGMVED